MRKKTAIFFLLPSPCNGLFKEGLRVYIVACQGGWVSSKTVAKFRKIMIIRFQEKLRTVSI